MTYSLLDDKFHSHPKTRKAWRLSHSAVGLYVMALSYCNDHNTDGVIDAEWVHEKLPRERERERAVDALLAARLWEIIDGAEGWCVHDFLDHNPSKEEVLQKRADLAAKRAEAGRLGGLAKAAKAKQLAKPLPALAVANPSPTPPHPLTTTGRLEHEEFARDMTAWAAHYFPAADPNRVAAVVQHMRASLGRQGTTADVTAETVRQYAARHPAWSLQD